VEIDGTRERGDGGPTDGAENVIRLPTDWVGPREDLIPIDTPPRVMPPPGGRPPRVTPRPRAGPTRVVPPGPSGPAQVGSRPGAESAAAGDEAAPAERAQGAPPAPGDFWGEDSAALHDAVQAPGWTGPAILPRHDPQGARADAPQTAWGEPVPDAGLAVRRVAMPSGVSRRRIMGGCGAIVAVALVTLAVVGAMGPSGSGRPAKGGYRTASAGTHRSQPGSSSAVVPSTTSAATQSPPHPRTHAHRSTRRVVHMATASGKTHRTHRRRPKSHTATRSAAGAQRSGNQQPAGAETRSGSVAGGDGHPQAPVYTAPSSPQPAFGLYGALAPGHSPDS
jgi:hypothetical protein